MNIILLSGGSGKRLWPLSNDVRSKQFIKLFKDERGNYESMVQRVYRQITTVDADAKVTIATSKSQASAIKNQLGEKASLLRQAAYEQGLWPRSPRTAVFGGRFALHASALALRDVAGLF